MHHIPSSLILGYTVMRVALGIILTIFGYNKLSFAWTNNTENLIQIGSAIQLFGITSGFMWWGYAAALTEFLGGIAFISGFLARYASLPLIWLFIVAIRFHIDRGDAFSVWGFAFLCLSVCLGILIAEH